MEIPLDLLLAYFLFKLLNSCENTCVNLCEIPSSLSYFVTWEIWKISRKWNFILSYLQCDLSRQIVMLFVCPLQHSLSVQSVWTISSFSQFCNLKWFLSFEKRYSYLLFCSKNVLYYISVWPKNKIWIFGFFLIIIFLILYNIS